jgi:integrase
LDISIENFLSSHPYAETTKRTYTDILQRLLLHEPQSLTASSIIQFINSNHWGNARSCLALAASKKYLAWAYGQSHPALSAKIKRIEGKPQRALTSQTALQLLSSFNPHTAKGSRDLAIASLALDTGLRESELCRLKQADTDTEHRVLQVLIKGGQWKAAIFGDETAAHIDHWKEFRKELHPKGELFCNIFTGQGLTPAGLQSIVKVWGRTIGIKLSPHDFRRSFAVLATEAGAPERVLMEGGRWNDAKMIQKYTRTLKLETMRKYLPVHGVGG